MPAPVVLLVRDGIRRDAWSKAQVTKARNPWGSGRPNGEPIGLDARSGGATFAAIRGVSAPILVGSLLLSPASTSCSGCTASPRGAR